MKYLTMPLHGDGQLYYSSLMQGTTIIYSIHMFTLQFSLIQSCILPENLIQLDTNAKNFGLNLKESTMMSTKQVRPGSGEWCTKGRPRRDHIS